MEDSVVLGLDQLDAILIVDVNHLLDDVPDLPFRREAALL